MPLLLKSTYVLALNGTLQSFPFPATETRNVKNERQFIQMADIFKRTKYRS